MLQPKKVFAKKEKESRLLVSLEAHAAVYVWKNFDKQLQKI
jgi:hypothetical protein